MNSENFDKILEKGFFLQTRRDELYIKFGGEAVVGNSYGAALLRGVILSRADLQSKIDWELRSFVAAANQAENEVQNAESDYYRDLITEKEYFEVQAKYYAAVMAHNEARDRITLLYEDQLNALRKQREEANQLYNDPACLLTTFKF